MTDAERRSAIQQHWDASNDADMDAVHAIYSDDVIVDFPQSGEQIRGKQKLQGFRASYPAQLDFSIRRIVGQGGLWITEYVIRYDGNPVSTVSIMEFGDDEVVRETLYFADPLDPPEWRAEWVEVVPH